MRSANLKRLHEAGSVVIVIMAGLAGQGAYLVGGWSSALVWIVGHAVVWGFWTMLYYTASAADDIHAKLKEFGAITRAAKSWNRDRDEFVRRNHEKELASEIGEMSEDGTVDLSAMLGE